MCLRRTGERDLLAMVFLASELFLHFHNDNSISRMLGSPCQAVVAKPRIARRRVNSGLAPNTVHAGRTVPTLSSVIHDRQNQKGLMSAFRVPEALAFNRIDRAGADAVLSLHLGGRETLDFLGPVEIILRAVRSGLAHLLFGMEDATGLVGFFVVHPDRRDTSCWWLGWFAVAQSHQGRGYGRLAMEHVIQRLRRVNGCRRIRLHVAAANGPARRLYGSAGFSECGTVDAGWHTLEYVLPPQVPVAAAVRGFVAHAAPARQQRRRMRLRSSVGPFAARSIGTVRGPPAVASADGR